MTNEEFITYLEGVSKDKKVRLFLELFERFKEAYKKKEELRNRCILLHTAIENALVHGFAYGSEHIDFVDHVNQTDFINEIENNIKIRDAFAKKDGFDPWIDRIFFDDVLERFKSVVKYSSKYLTDIRLLESYILKKREAASILINYFNISEKE